MQIFEVASHFSFRHCIFSPFLMLKLQKYFFKNDKKEKKGQTFFRLQNYSYGGALEYWQLLSYLVVVCVVNLTS